MFEQGICTALDNVDKWDAQQRWSNASAIAAEILEKIVPVPTALLFFGESIIGHGSLTLQSPDLTPHDFFFGDFSNNKFVLIGETKS